MCNARYSSFPKIFRTDPLRDAIALDSPIHRYNCVQGGVGDSIPIGPIESRHVPHIHYFAHSLIISYIQNESHRFSMMPLVRKSLQIAFHSWVLECFRCTIARWKIRVREKRLGNRLPARRSEQRDV